MKLFLNGILFPVAPESITRKIKNQNKTQTTINGEQITLIRPAGLTDITLGSVMLPNNPYDFIEYEGGVMKSATFYLDELEK